MTDDKLLKKSFAGFWQMLVVWQRYQCLVEVGSGIFNGPIGVSRDATDGVACKSMRGDAIKWRHIIRVFDLYPHAKVAMKLWGVQKG